MMGHIPGRGEHRDQPEQPTAPSGWHPDPWGQAGERWWDGSQWTGVTRNPQPTSADPTTRWLVIGSAAALVVGAFLPWASMSAAFVGTMSHPGIAGDGVFTAALGVAALIVAGPLMSSRPLPRQRAIWLIVIGVVAGFIGAAAAFNVTEGARQSEVMIAQVGIGVWMTIAAAVVLVIGAGRQVSEAS